MHLQSRMNIQKRLHWRFVKRHKNDELNVIYIDKIFRNKLMDNLQWQGATILVVAPCWCVEDLRWQNSFAMWIGKLPFKSVCWLKDISKKCWLFYHFLNFLRGWYSTRIMIRRKWFPLWEHNYPSWKSYVNNAKKITENDLPDIRNTFLISAYYQMLC